MVRLKSIRDSLTDISQDELGKLGISTGDSLLRGGTKTSPWRVLQIEQALTPTDMEFLAQQVFGTTDTAHPGVTRTYAYKNRFLGGPITLVNTPVINPPFDRFWNTPRQLRETLAKRDWNRVVAHQSRNVPHSGHEWLMKGAWFAAEADGILVSAVVGEKKTGGDYIDEAIVLAHDRLRGSGLLSRERSYDFHPLVGHAVRGSQRGGVPRPGPQELGLYPSHVRPGSCRGRQLL